MQFLVLGYDGDDPGAMERRLAARPDHLALADRMKEEGTLLFAVAQLDEADRMVGSVMILDVADRATVDRYLEEEPYVVGQVWARVEVTPCRVGPSFAAEPR